MRTSDVELPLPPEPEDDFDRVAEAKLAKFSKGRERFIPSKTIRGRIRHRQLFELEVLAVNGVQAISVEGQEFSRAARKVWVVWTGIGLTHLEDDHRIKVPGDSGMSWIDIHEELHGEQVHVVAHRSKEPIPPEPSRPPATVRSKFRERLDPDGTSHSFCYSCGKEVPEDEVQEWGAWGEDALGFSTTVRAHRRCREEGLEWRDDRWAFKAPPTP